MKTSRRVCTAAFAIIIAASVPSFAGLKNNDFTKANASFKKENREPEKSRLQDEKSGLQDEKFKSETFRPADDARYLEDRRFKDSGGEMGRVFSERRKSPGGTYEPPDLKIFRDGRSFEKDLHLENKDRNLSKKYEGTIDFSGRHPQNAYMREFLAHTQERSMQEINKYMFRSSHSSDPGIPTVGAGSQLHGDGESPGAVSDFLFGRKSVGRTAVSFKKDVRVGSVSPSESVFEKGAPVKAPSAEIPAGARLLPAQVIGEAKSGPASPPEKKIKVAEKEVDKGQSSSIFSPNAGGMSTGKYKIKVEVSDP